MESKDHYKTLGLERQAKAEEIKAAYRRLARKYHPDVSTESDAEARFKDINEAYDILGNHEKKQTYDTKPRRPHLRPKPKKAREFTPPPGWQASHFDADFFEDIARSDRPGSRQQRSNNGFSEGLLKNKNAKKNGSVDSNEPQIATIQLALEDVYWGVSRKIRLPDGRSLQVTIPKGIKEGEKIRIHGGSGRSELHLKVKVKPHSHFTLDGKNIRLKLPITPWEAALGSLITVPTLETNVSLRIPEGVQTGKKMRLQGRGLPGDPAGDQLITLVIMTPPVKKDTERNLYRRMETEFAWNPREGML